MAARDKVDVAIWALIYGGLLTVAVTLFLPDQSAVLAAWMLAGGGLLTAVGAALIYVRSKMKATGKQPTGKDAS